MERWSSFVVALGVLGMVGFVGSFALVAVGWVGVSGSLALAVVSLSSYSVSLIVGHFGDPLAFCRRSSGAEWSWRRERATLRSIRVTIGHA